MMVMVVNLTMRVKFFSAYCAPMSYGVQEL